MSTLSRMAARPRGTLGPHIASNVASTNVAPTLNFLVLFGLFGFVKSVLEGDVGETVADR